MKQDPNKIIQKFFEENAELLKEATIAKAAKKGVRLTDSDLKANTTENIIAALGDSWILYVNSGRAPESVKQSKAPPVTALIDFTKKLSLPQGVTPLDAAFMLQKTIHEKGTKGKKFIMPAKNAFKKQLMLNLDVLQRELIENLELNDDKSDTMHVII